MPYIIRKREGPTWIKHIFLIDGGQHIEGFLEGENMNNITVFSVLPEGKKGSVISEGRLRVKKGLDQGHVASFLVFKPNKRKYPNQSQIIIQRVV